MRKNYADYPASKDRPAFRHDDWMVMYPEANELRADYFDNEGHVIHYTVTATADRNGAVFLSPGYRLTYTRVTPEKIKIKFEVAPPGKADQFTTYLDASAVRALNVRTR